MRYCHRAVACEAGLTAAQILQRRFGLSGSHLKQIRLRGRFWLNGQDARLNIRIQAGDLLEVDDLCIAADLAELAGRAALAGIPVCYQDDWLLALVKPAGMLVHPSAGSVSPSVLTALGRNSLHFVNRLDRDTSGLLLIASEGSVQTRLRQQPMTRHYLALLHGSPRAPDGLIQLPLRRRPGSLIARDTCADGSPARTLWHILRQQPNHNLTLADFQLLSGKTHQIRVHAAAIGTPLVGDTLYNNGRPADSWDCQIARQALHAARLEFNHPVTDQPLVLRADLPDDMQQLIEAIWPDCDDPNGI